MAMVGVDRTCPSRDRVASPHTLGPNKKLNVPFKESEVNGPQGGVVRCLELEVVPAYPESEQTASKFTLVPGPGDGILLGRHLEEAVCVHLGDLDRREVRLKHGRHHGQGLRGEHRLELRLLPVVVRLARGGLVLELIVFDFVESLAVVQALLIPAPDRHEIGFTLR